MVICFSVSRFFFCFYDGIDVIFLVYWYWQEKNLPVPVKKQKDCLKERKGGPNKKVLRKSERLLILEETCNKNLQSNEDKNASTKNSGFVCQLCAGFLSDAESCIADKEGNDTNQ